VTNIRSIEDLQFENVTARSERLGSLGLPRVMLMLRSSKLSRRRL